jgi:hypothetical protein
MIPQELQKWLDEQCPEEHLAKKDGVLYLPNHICEKKLDSMQSQFNVVWNTRNYKSTLYLFNGAIWISASLELVIEGWFEDVRPWKKVLVGCATFMASTIAPNTHLDATAKSFCTVNAAMDLGDQFGRFLSTQLTPQSIERKLLPPSVVELKKFEKAVAAKDYSTILDLLDVYDIKIEDDLRTELAAYKFENTSIAFG